MLTLVTRRLHYVQREFMMQTLMFFLFTGIAALIFSKVEKTTYVDGIYFMVVTTLTVGFGDITPHTAIMKVLTFPFTIIGITLLALIVTSIVRLLTDRARRRKLELKKRLKKKVSEKKRIHASYGLKLRPWSARSPTRRWTSVAAKFNVTRGINEITRRRLEETTEGKSEKYAYWSRGIRYLLVHRSSYFQFRRGMHSTIEDVDDSHGDTAILSTFVTCSSLSNPS